MEMMRKPALLKRFELRLHNSINIKMHKVRVVKDEQRHIIHLVGNPIRVTLMRTADKKIYASCNKPEFFGLVEDLPRFMIRLLS